MAKASDLMTQDVATVRGSATVAEAVKLMRYKEIHSLVVDRRTEDDAYGIVTDKDITSKVVAYGKDPAKVKVYEIMTKPCVVVNPDLSIEYVARLFAQTGVDRAPVIRNELLGIISTTDILNQGDFLENPRVPLLERTLQQEIANARTASATYGPDSEACLKAWQVVNELEAELAFCKGVTPEKSAFEQFGDRPSVAEPTPVAGSC